MKNSLYLEKVKQMKLEPKIKIERFKLIRVILIIQFK